ncbi:IclR family transcriptional regulator [Corynebacterium hylobatis]|uniref:IclR family transcriptional regulator n=1 Tax=Corynebacterium hylobatis TaxID=1859290 RepID=A0A430HY04_9CORY|nr:helix-turn-helix domain-containing protein [Corynebacterium hylobatis]RSZ63179.1 IclR family transcriptional regulator [Corynebacterium hylobatis]
MDGDKPGNRMLERVAAILDAVEDEPRLAADIARTTGLSLSTTHRLALSMAELDFLTRYPDGTFGPGTRILQTYRDAVSYQPLWELASRAQESVQLWVRYRDERVCRVSIDAPHELRVTLPQGSRLPLPAGSAGQILAGTPEAEKQLSQHSWVESEGNRVPGVGSVSAPVIVDGKIVGVVCLAAPLSRVVRSIGQDYGDLVAETAAKISRLLV